MIEKNYLKSFASACLDGAVIALAVVIFSAYTQSPWLAFDWQGATSGIGAVFAWAGDQTARLAYCFSMVFNMLVLMGTIKTSDRLVHKLVGI